MFILSVSSFYCFAQDSVRAGLFQPGTELVYQVYNVKLVSIGKRSYTHSTQLVFTVKDVKYDSVSDTYFSHIEKRGIPSDEYNFDGWHTNQTVIRKSDQVKLPLGFYITDTLFFKGGKHPTILCTAQIEDASINYPLTNNDKIRLQLPSFQFVESYWVSEQDRNGFSTKSEQKYEGTADLISRTIMGEETVETPAGKFPCIKISVVIGYKFSNSFGKGNREYIEYFSPEYGIVKTVPTSKFNYYELIRIKKPS